MDGGSDPGRGDHRLGRAGYAAVEFAVGAWLVARVREPAAVRA